jgi:hypothetical protein
MSWKLRTAWQVLCFLDKLTFSIGFRIFGIMEHFRIFVADKKYSEWQVINVKTDTPTILTGLSPLHCKLLNNDIFTFDNGIVRVVSSSHRNIAGVIIISKTYGTYKDKFLYKCIPHDGRLPEFLVSYNIPKSFQKNLTPVYVSFKFKSWDDKHPRGEIVKTIGTTDVLSNFYEYQLVCKNLDISMKKFNNDVRKRLSVLPTPENLETIRSKYNITDRLKQYVFTVDNEDTRDYDDAISINSTETGYIISVYISNVALWMETYNIWNSFSERISTIYLPDQKRPMIPSILSDCLCSLKKGENRFAFTMDMCITENHNSFHVSKISYSNCFIRVRENLSYSNCHHIPEYRKLFKVLCRISPNKMSTSRDVVNYLMVSMNHNVSCSMIKCNNGIFRNVNTLNRQCGTTESPDNLPEDVYNYLTQYRNTFGEYVKYKDMTEHNHLKLESYLHITSPIRRIVDLLNMIQIQTNLGMMTFGTDAGAFHSDWIGRLDYINTSMRATRKLQNICNVMSLFGGVFNDDVYKGYVFDKITKVDGQLQYSVYIPNIKYTCKLLTPQYFREYSPHYFEVYMFKDEYNINKKIKISYHHT